MLKLYYKICWWNIIWLLSLYHELWKYLLGEIKTKNILPFQFLPAKKKPMSKTQSESMVYRSKKNEDVIFEALI